jgi:hypothetical protein
VSTKPGQVHLDDIVHWDPLYSVRRRIQVQSHGERTDPPLSWLCKSIFHGVSPSVRELNLSVLLSPLQQQSTKRGSRVSPYNHWHNRDLCTSMSVVLFPSAAGHAGRLDEPARCARLVTVSLKCLEFRLNQTIDKHPEHERKQEDIDAPHHPQSERPKVVPAKESSEPLDGVKQWMFHSCHTRVSDET